MDKQHDDHDEQNQQRGELETPDFSQHMDEKPAKPKRSLSWFFMLITFVIAVVALVLVIISWTRDQYGLGLGADQSKTNQASIAALQQKVNGFQDTLNTFSSNSQTQQHQIAAARYAVEKLISEVNQNQDIWQLTEAEHLLQIANYTLSFAHDVPTTIAVLQAADSRLQGLGDPDVYSVRKLVAQEITQLQVLPKLDVPGIYSRLEALRKTVMQLPVLRNRFKKDTSDNNYLQKKNPAEKGSFTHGVWHALSKVVVVRQRKQKVEPILSTNDHMILAQNLYLLFSQAEWGLIQRQQSIYETSLKQIQEILNLYYDHIPDEVKNINQQLMALEKININPALPKIGDALKVTQKLLQSKNEQLLQGKSPSSESKKTTKRSKN